MTRPQRTTLLAMLRGDTGLDRRCLAGLRRQGLARLGSRTAWSGLRRDGSRSTHTESCWLLTDEGRDLAAQLTQSRRSP